MIVDLDYTPKGWKKIKFQKVLFFQEGPGVRNWQFTEEGVKLLNVGNINKGQIDLNKTSIHLSTEEATGKYAHFLVDEGDLLIACSGIVVDNFHNKIAFAEKEHLPLCLNTSTMRFKSLNGEIDLNYFKYYLQTVHFTSQLRKLITGSAQLNFGPSHIKKINLILPPLETQKHIAQILDDASALRLKTEQILKEYDLLAQSLFLDMFGDPVKNEKGWEIKELHEVASISSGITKGRKNKPGDSIGELPYMRVANVQDGYLDLTEIKTIPAFKTDLEKFSLQKGDVLMTEGGDPDKLGRGAVWQNEIEKCLHQNHIFKVRVDSNVLTPLYFNKLAGSLYGKKYFLKIAKQTTGIATINKTQLSKFPVLMASTNLQNQFEEKIALIEKQKELAKQERKESEDLFNCLLQKAFKGELA